MNRICHHSYLLITSGDSAAVYEWMYRYPTFFTASCLCLGSLEPQDGPVLICAVMVQWHHLSATIPSVSPPDFLWLHWVAWTQALSSPRTAVAQTLLSCLSHTIQSKKDLIPSHLALFCLSGEWVCVWECHSFSWQYQKELFLLFRGCRFGRILRNLNQVSLGPFQRRLESPRGLEALRRGSASKTSS